MRAEPRIHLTFLSALLALCCSFLRPSEAFSQPGFEHDLSRPSVLVHSSYYQAPTLPTCDPDDAEVFIFDSLWRLVASFPFGWSGGAPCTSDEERAACMSNILNLPEKRIFCFEPGEYLSGDDSVVLLTSSGSTGAPRVLRSVDRLDWQDRRASDEAILRTSVQMVDAHHWVISGLTLAEDHRWLKAHKRTYDWDREIEVEAQDGVKRRYLCGSDLDGYIFFDGVEEGYTLDLQCSSDNVFDRLRITDSQAPPVRIALASHRNLLQDSLIGYSAAMAAPWLEAGEGLGPLEFAARLTAEIESNEDAYNLGAIEGSPAPHHREYGHFLQDNYCVALHPWQSKVGKTGTNEEGGSETPEEFPSWQQTVRGNHIVDNEFVNCNDAVKLTAKPDIDPLRYPTGNAHRFRGTVIQGNDMYIEPSLYTDCNGNLPAASTEAVQSICSTAENAIDAKGGGGASLGSVSVADLVLIDGNRMNGYRTVDPTLASTTGIGQRSARGRAVVLHGDASHVLATRNLIFDSTSGFVQAPNGGRPRSELPFAWVGNLFFQIRWNPLPDLEPIAGLPADDWSFATDCHHDGGTTPEARFDPLIYPSLWPGGDVSWTDGWYAAAMIFTGPTDLYFNTVVNSRNWHEARGFEFGVSDAAPTRFVCNAVTHGGPGGAFLERRYCDESGAPRPDFIVEAIARSNAYFDSGTLPASPSGVDEWNDAVDTTAPSAATHATYTFLRQRISGRLQDGDLSISSTWGSFPRVLVPNALLRDDVWRDNCTLLRDGSALDGEDGFWWWPIWRELQTRNDGDPAQTSVSRSVSVLGRP